MKFLSPHVYSLIFFGFSAFLHAQDGVGVNTTTPRTTLEVAGDTHINGAINVNVLNQVSDSDNTAILGQIDTDFIKELNVNAAGTAIAYFQEYDISNMGGSGDWIRNLNTNVSSANYVMTIISVYFNKELRMDYAPNNFVIPYASAFIENGTWHITADYASAYPVSSTPVGRWIISTLILSKDFSKQFPQQTVNLSGTNNARRGGAATTPVID